MTDPTTPAEAVPAPVDITLYTHAVLWQTGRTTVEAAVATTPADAVAMLGGVPPGAVAVRLISIPVQAAWFPSAVPTDPTPVT